MKYLLQLSLFFSTNALIAANSSKVQWNGSGCSAKTMELELKDDRITTRLENLDSFVVRRGAQVSLGESRKNCAGVFEIHPPAGWQFSLERVLISGEQDLQKGDALELGFDMNLQGAAETRSEKFAELDKQGKTFKVEKQIATEAKLWSGCQVNRAMTVNVKQRIAAGCQDLKQISEARIKGMELSFALKKCD